MGLFSMLMTAGKARIMSRMLSRVVGGPLAATLVAGWLGRKAYQNRQRRLRPY